MELVTWQIILIIISWFITKWIMRALFVVFIMQAVARIIDQIKNSLKGGQKNE